MESFSSSSVADIVRRKSPETMLSRSVSSIVRRWTKLGVHIYSEGSTCHFELRRSRLNLWRCLIRHSLCATRRTGNCGLLRPGDILKRRLGRCVQQSSAIRARVVDEQPLVVVVLLVEFPNALLLADTDHSYDRFSSKGRPRKNPGWRRACQISKSFLIRRITARSLGAV